MTFDESVSLAFMLLLRSLNRLRPYLSLFLWSFFAYPCSALIRVQNLTFTVAPSFAFGSQSQSGTQQSNDNNGNNASGSQSQSQSQSQGGSGNKESSQDQARRQREAERLRKVKKQLNESRAKERL